MTISATYTPAQASGNGVTVAFPFTFKTFEQADLVVIITDADDVDTTQTITTHYTVSLNADQNNNPGGTVTMLTAPASGTTLTIAREIDALQETDIANGGGFYPEVLEDAFDRLTMLSQQNSDAIARSFSLPVTVAGVNTELPVPAANNIVGWNPTADALQNFEPSVFATVVAFGTANADIFDGDGVTTDFTLTANPGAQNNLDVSISGITQTPGIDYTWTAGTTIIFVVAPPAGTDNVLVRYMQGLPAGVIADESVTAASINPTEASGIVDVLGVNTIVFDAKVDSDIVGFQMLNANSLGKIFLLDGFLDKFVDGNFVDATESLNEVLNASYYYENLRPYKDTLDDDQFDNLTAWTDDDIGTGTTTIVLTGSSDTAIGANAARFNTGATAGAGNRAIQHQDYGAGNIPANFGVTLIINQVAQGTSGNFFHVQIDNGVYTFAFRFYSTGIYYLDSGSTEVLLFDHGTEGVWSEYWFECNSTTKRIMLFAGTVLLADVTAATLLASTDNGRVQMRQNGNTETNRITDVGVFQLGSSALPAQLTLVSNAYECDFLPARAELVILLDDVSAYTVINTTFIAYLSIDDGSTWQAVTLTERSVYGDSISNLGGSYVRVLTGELDIVSPADKTCRLKVVAAGAPVRQVNIHGWALHLKA